MDESKTGTPAEGGVLRRRLVGEPATLNPILQSSVPEQQVLQYLSRSLFDFDARLNLVPGLAQGYTVSGDGLEYTVALRPEAIWEDGSPVTAADAVFTIRRMVDPAVPAPVFKPLFEDLEKVEALGERAFRVRFREPYAFRPMAFVIPVLPERRFAGETFLKSRENRAPFSNGPYRLARWKSQQAIELERNPRYWGKRPHFDRILFRILPENPASYRILVAGDLDESWIDTGLKERAERDPDFQACCRTVEYYDLGYNYIALNNSSPLFSDARVRRAMTMLLDRASMVRNLYHGSARIISGPWAPDSPAYDPRVTPLPFDPPRAATLLTEAGFRDADGNGVRERAGRPFEFEILVSAGTTVGRQIDEIFAAELSRVGVRATVRTLEWASFIERVDSGRYEAASLAWSAADPNPDPYYYWHSSQAAPRGLNSVFYRSPEADRLMEEARREREEGRRRELYHRLHRLLRDDSPVVFVVNASQKYAFRKRVRGLVSSPLGFFGFWPGPLSWWGDPSDAAPARAAGGLS